MPQMMPINWLFYFFFFLCIFIMYNIMNYYIFYNLNMNNKKLKNFKKNFFNWKW
uniref:ATP synthase complex subunit 8 n=2 Tax=Colias TaxID=42295 RepID=A0A0U2C506_COLER|nr:ATP synthase F0 subunit 8 [Colias erate]AJG02531.1 ATP synthase F0 subunit 8 [Colias croceus]AKJ25926.1 ATP synthase F0 subunit 8 [Colias erate]USM09827.1 ATP synthase F0 subunit 8 [Colias erate]